MGMKQVLVIMVAVVLVGQSVVADEEKLIADPIVEKAIRFKLVGNVERKLTEADLEKIIELSLESTKITDAGLKDVAKLQKLRVLYLKGTQITDAGVAELKKALPNCKIYGP